MSSFNPEIYIYTLFYISQSSLEFNFIIVFINNCMNIFGVIVGVASKKRLQAKTIISGLGDNCKKIHIQLDCSYFMAKFRLALWKVCNLKKNLLRIVKLLKFVWVCILYFTDEKPQAVSSRLWHLRCSKKDDDARWSRVIFSQFLCTKVLLGL